VIAGAAAFVFDDAGRLLVVKENYGRFRWSLPGGAIEEGESPEDACVREAVEETGAEVRIDYLVGTYELPDITVHAYRCTIERGEPALQPTEELSAVEWLRPDAIPDPRSNVLHHALDDALAGRRGVARTGLARIT
jgi:8-oxo-dGTP pyrophosphatase MutT (NUDIX family)